MNIKTIVAFLALFVCGLASAQLRNNPVTLAASAAPIFAPGQTLNTGKINTYLYTPAQAASFTVDGAGVAVGAHTKLIITTSGTTSYLLTFSTGFNSRGTLQTGTTSGTVFVLDFAWDGTTMQELSRVRENNTTVVVPYVVTTSVFNYSEGVLFYTFTPVTAVTLNSAVVPRAGATVTIAFIGDSTGRTTTFGTGFNPASTTIATGADTKSLIWVGVSNGTSIYEVSRTVAE